MNNIVVIGIGLIGGSIVKDLKKIHPDTKIIGVDKNADHINEALASGLIDEKGDLNAVKDADLVILSIPVDVSVDLLSDVLDLVSDDTLVIDVGSTKLDICKKSRTPC